MLAEAETASSADDTIFVYEGSSDYTGGLTLKSGQKLIGEGNTKVEWRA